MLRFLEIPSPAASRARISSDLQEALDLCATTLALSFFILLKGKSEPEHPAASYLPHCDLASRCDANHGNKYQYYQIEGAKRNVVAVKTLATRENIFIGRSWCWESVWERQRMQYV
jgi:hypothetical protein